MVALMKLSKYQKRFGIGPIGLIISLVLFFILGRVNKWLGYVEILSRPRSAKILGIILLCIEVCWHIWCLCAFKTWLRDGRLCTKGPYKLVRHPIYAGIIFFVCPGIAFIFNSWIILLSAVLLFPIWTALVRREESIMNAIFGEEYARYASHTGRLFPGFLSE
jgi:protein-S-isoprenylcysteine O-methyltransferase Ste14